MENTRQKQVYDVFFKSRTRRFGWMVLGAFLLEHIGDKVINAFWVKKNSGKLFRDIEARLLREKGPE